MKIKTAAGTSDSYTTPFDSLKNELVVANEMQIPPYIRSKTDGKKKILYKNTSKIFIFAL